MATLTLGQQNPLMYRRSFPDPSVLERLDIDALRGHAERLGLPWEYPVWEVDGNGDRVNERMEAHPAERLRDILADHQTGAPSPSIPAAVTTIITSPSSSLREALAEIETVVARHGDAPEWVDGDDAGLVALVASMYGATVGTPDDVEDRFYTLNGPAGVGPAEPPAGKKGGGGLAPFLGFMLMLHLLLFRLSLYLRTNAGRDHQAGVCFSTASNGTGTYAASTYIGVTEDATSPAAGDTTLTSELAVEGFTRAQATYAHTAGTATVTHTKTFTMSGGTSRTLRHAANFNASSAGTMTYKTAVPSPPTTVSGDAVAFTWTFTL